MTPPLPKHLFSNPPFSLSVSAVPGRRGSHVAQQLGGGGGGMCETLLHSLLPFCPCSDTINIVCVHVFRCVCVYMGFPALCSRVVCDCKADTHLLSPVGSLICG